MAVLRDTLYCPQGSGGIRRGDWACFRLDCRHQDWERWKQLWGRTAFPTDFAFERLKDTAQSDAVGYALHILLDG